MIKELAWYMEEGRYTGLVTEFQKVMDDYAAAKSAGSPDAAEKREQVRRLYEEHAVKSGYKPEDNCFINVDTEFFQGASLNRPALNTFIKEIIRSHCYQKNLWTYMGTTGCMTVISFMPPGQKTRKAGKVRFSLRHVPSEKTSIALESSNMHTAVTVMNTMKNSRTEPRYIP